MKKQQLFYFLNLTLLLLLLAGCGGDESYISTSSTTATVPFRGVVEDGPIAGAKVSLRDKAGTYYPLYNSLGHDEYLVSTDENGVFSREVNAGTDFSNLTVRAVGGIDRDTGMDFSGLEMRSHLGLFNGDVSAIIVSPLTTLVAELHDQHGFTYAEAEKLLGDWLFPSADVDLAAAPHTNLDLQRCTLLLSKIAFESTKENPFALISKQVFIAETVVDVSVMEQLGIVDTDTQIQIIKLQGFLASATTIDEMFMVYKREELRNILEVNFKERLELSTPFVAQQNLNYQQNVEVLVQKILIAAGGEVFLFVDPIPSRLFRYVFSAYFLDKQTNVEMIKTLLRDWLTSDLNEFNASLTYDEIGGGIIPLEEDPWIALLARSSAANSVDSPLLRNELPSDNNQQRVAYFYSSELSPHFLAKQLIGRVSDDTISDAVLLKIVKERLDLGLLDDETTDILIKTKIISSESRGHAYLALANALIKYNRLKEARIALNLAENFYLKVIDSKGYASASSADVVNLLAMADAYLRAGDQPSSEFLVNVEVAKIAEKVIFDANFYGKLITGIKNVVDAYIAKGDYDAAAPLVEKMIRYSDDTPLYLGTYKLRIYNWIESAKRCAELGKGEILLEVYSNIKKLRSADAATSTATWVYIPDLIESLYRVGKPQEAMGLAKTIPSTSLYYGPAFKLSASYEALQVQMGTAFSIVDDCFPKVEDKLDVLTYYFAVKQKKPGIALALINAGRFSEARQSLQKAEELLTGLTQGSNLARIRYGYVRLAELYVLMGKPEDRERAAVLLQTAQAGIIDDVYSVPVMVDIALGYNKLNQTDVAQTLLAAARSLADINPTWYRTDVTSNLSQTEAATLLYETFVNAYEKIGEKELLHTTALNYLMPWAQQIHTAGTVNDTLAAKECEYLLRTALYLERSGYHADVLKALTAAKESAGQLAILASRLKRYRTIIETYAAVHEYDKALTLANNYLLLKEEYDQAIQSLANAILGRDDFLGTWVASIDSDGDGKPDFFHPLAATEDIADSGLILDDDSDGDGIIDTLDIRPLFKD